MIVKKLLLGGVLILGLVAATVWFVRALGLGQAVVVADQHGEEDELPLPAHERQYLWEIEHHGNLLNRHGFRALGAALRGGDQRDVARLLAKDFRGYLPSQTDEAKWDDDLIHVSRHIAVGESFRTLDSSEFVEHLLRLRRLFQRTPRVQFNLIKFSPEKRGDLAGNWRGNCLMRLFGFWQDGKPAEVVMSLDFGVKSPTEELLKAGSWLRSCKVLQVQVGKAEKFLFKDVTAARGIDPEQFHDNWKAKEKASQTGGVYLCDFNRDGLLDILITDGGFATTTVYLYQNMGGGKFQDVTTKMGLPRIVPKANCWAWVDLDGDGWEDLICNHTVFRNNDGQGFEPYSDRCNLVLPDDATAVVVADFDRDGQLDLYVTQSGKHEGNSWLSSKTVGGNHNHLFRNLGKWQFQDVTHSSGTAAANRSVFTAAWLDANNDGWPDLYVINELGDGVLLVNQKNGTFAEHRMADHPTDFGSMGLAAGDIDNDGNIDLFVAAMYSKAGRRVIGNLRSDAYPADIMGKFHLFVQGNQLHRNLGGLKFEQLGAQLQINGSGWAYGPGLIDVNNDGWLDIYSTAGFVSQSRDDPDG
jgi:hypothetical protein